MSDMDEEPYSTIFASMKHPIRRKILRMLSKNSMSFSEMLDALGVSSSFLTYHLDNLGELIVKIDDGKYRLSNFGEAAFATMTKVEDIPATIPLQSIGHSKGMRTNNVFPTKILRRTTAIALGIICIILIAGLGAVIAYYTLTINGKDNQITSATEAINRLNATAVNENNAIALLNGNVTDLTNALTQAQTWLIGNETSLIQAQAWLNGNISSYASQTSALQGQETQLENWLNGNISYYAAQIESLNSEIDTLNDTISQLTSFPIGLYMTYEQFSEWTGHNETTLMTWNITGVQDGLADLQLTSYDVEVNASDNSPIISAADDNWTIDLSNREIVNSTNEPYLIGLECPFWIEKNVTIGSVVNTIFGQATITGSETLNVLGQQRDCWIVNYEWPTSSMVRWYDKETGMVLLIQVARQEQGITITSNETATETNVVKLSQGY